MGGLPLAVAMVAEIRASAYPCTVEVASPSSGLVPNQVSWILASVPSFFSSVMTSLTLAASGASLANITEYCSVVLMRSTTLNCGLSLE